MRTFSLSPLPDENGRKLVGDWGGTTRGSFRFGWMLLVNGYTIPYTSAEIPPTKGARSRTLQIPRTSQPIQKLPCTATAVQKARKVFAPHPAVAVQGSSGRVREVWRVGSPFQGVSLRLQGLPFLPPTSTSTSMSSSDSIAPWFCDGGKPQRQSKAPCRPQRI